MRRVRVTLDRGLIRFRATLHAIKKVKTKRHAVSIVWKRQKHQHDHALVLYCIVSHTACHVFLGLLVLLYCYIICMQLYSPLSDGLYLLLRF